MTPTVLVTSRIPSAVLTRLQAGVAVDLPGGEGPMSAEALRDRLSGKQGLLCVVTDTLDDAMIAAGRDLRIIANIAVGYDNIDVHAAAARGIVVTNTPGVLTDAVAELTWGLILAATRRISEGGRLVQLGGWNGWALNFMLGMELHGKQLGIIGAGRIGRAVAARAPAFGMHVAFAARGGAPNQGTGTTDSTAAAEVMPLDRLLVSSDVVSLHVPLTPETHHLIDRRTLARMKRSAFLINTARGPVVDEAALAWALHERLIAGAALDVYEREPVVHPDLLELPNVILSPHLGSATRETRTAMADLAARNVLEVLSGRPPVTPVTP